MNATTAPFRTDLRDRTGPCAVVTGLHSRQLTNALQDDGDPGARVCRQGPFHRAALSVVRSRLGGPLCFGPREYPPCVILLSWPRVHSGLMHEGHRVPCEI
jgi:hypothetical protein